MIDKIICFIFGHKENYLEGLYVENKIREFY